MPIAHTELEPIKGASAREKTAVTMKTIQQLLAEEAAKTTQVPVSPKPSTERAEAAAQLKATTAPAVEALKTVPPMPLPDQPKAKAPEAKVRKAEALPPITPAPAPEKPRSFLGRLIGS